MPPALPRPPGCFLCLPIRPWPALTWPLFFLFFFRSARWGGRAGTSGQAGGAPADSRSNGPTLKIARECQTKGTCSRRPGSSDQTRGPSRLEDRAREQVPGLLAAHALCNSRVVIVPNCALVTPLCGERGSPDCTGTLTGARRQLGESRWKARKSLDTGPARPARPGRAPQCRDVAWLIAR